MTQALFGGIAAALVVLTIGFTRRHPGWWRAHKAPPARHATGAPPPAPPRPPAPRDFGRSRLPSAAERTAALAAIETSGEPPWDWAQDGDWEQEPDLEPLPEPVSPPHACPDVPDAIVKFDGELSGEELEKFRHEFEIAPRPETAVATVITGYMIDGKVVDPADVTIVTDAQPPPGDPLEERPWADSTGSFAKITAGLPPEVSATLGKDPGEWVDGLEWPDVAAIFAEVRK